MKEPEEVLNNAIEVDALNEDQFLQVAETLRRIGLIKRGTNSQSGEKPKLFQSVCVLHKRGKYYLIHFKQLYQLDYDKAVETSEEDLKRLENIASLLQQWNMVRPVKAVTYDPKIKTVVVKHSDKNKFDFIQPYSIGR